KEPNRPAVRRPEWRTAILGPGQRPRCRRIQRPQPQNRRSADPRGTEDNVSTIPRNRLTEDVRRKARVNRRDDHELADRRRWYATALPQPRARCCDEAQRR